LHVRAAVRVLLMTPVQLIVLVVVLLAPTLIHVGVQAVKVIVAFFLS
jgi:hypothetical protein